MVVQTSQSSTNQLTFRCFEIKMRQVKVWGDEPPADQGKETLKKQMEEDLHSEAVPRSSPSFLSLSVF